MKFRFESSDKLYELKTTTSTITQDDFVKMLSIFMFKDKDPTCSFELTNCQDNEYINCDTDVPIVKKGYAKLFQQPTKMEMTKEKAKEKAKPKRRRWRSRSPVQRKRRVRRWRSRSPKRTRWR